MTQPLRFLFIGWMTLASGFVLAECPVSQPSSSPVEVPGASETDSRWFGSDALAVMLPWRGTLKGLGPKHNYREKMWFWRRGYKAESEGRPALTVTGVKLESRGDSTHLSVRGATNAMGPGWEQMLALVEFPSGGCWELTATYVRDGIEQELKFVIRVGNEPTDTDTA